MSLCVLAVSAPQFPAGTVGKRALSSADPVSLFNACRLAAEAALGPGGPWANSNFAGSRANRRAATLLLQSCDELTELERRLVSLRPNLLLIGSMSICLPGAIACARLARELLGEGVCIVLGGRHSTESIYEHPAGGVCHHVSSPLRLIAEGVIEPVFDVAVSGDGESFVLALGELVADVVRRRAPAASARERLGELTRAPGRWLAGTASPGRIQTVSGNGGPLPYDRLPSPAELFGVRAAFDVFDGRKTAHVFSDVGRGCIYDCRFCSERRSVTGFPADLDGSPDRLFRHLATAVRVIEEDHPGAGASAFVEDSTLLAFSPPLVRRFVRRLRDAELDVRFGAQLTIDQILSRGHLLEELREVGLSYLFLGLETASPETVGGMSKDVRRWLAPWMTRAEQALERLRDLGIRCGVAVLFGLGEPHAVRLGLAEQLLEWRRLFGQPYPVSMNWAVQHPLRGDDGGTSYTYTDWGVPEGPFLELFRDFGEASVRYPLAGQAAPVLAEVREVHQAFAPLKSPGHPPSPLSGSWIPP